MSRFLLFFMLLLGASVAQATHNRGGNITYVHLGGNTYQVTIMTCTYSHAPADRPELPDFQWGDGTIDTLYRDSIVFYTHPSNPDYDSQKNYYTGVHTYNGPGVYKLCMVDPNRNAGIENICNSVNVAFAIQSEIVISPFTGNYNNSIVLTECPCPELACVLQPYCYNIAAFDPDGDSLGYELVVPMGNQCNPLAPGQYVFPDEPIGGACATGGGGNMTIDPVTGTICWDSPQITGEFNFAIKVTEYRNGLKVGFVIRDIQLFVINQNCNNDAPEIEPLEDTCIVAGTSLNIDVDYSDDVGTDVEGYGEPFSASPSAFMIPGPFAQSGTATFVWNTGCTNVQASAYPTYFIAQDGGDPVQLQDIETMFITVNGPPVTGLSVSPQGNGMNISWDASICTNVTGYKIYRASANDTINSTQSCCDQGAAAMMGYTLIATTGSHGDTTYYDQGGLVIGNEYCYIVTACFGPDVESCPSNAQCGQLQMDVPVITHVSVVTTDGASGLDQICWAMPKELDTVNQWGQHRFFYKVHRSPGNAFTGATTEVHNTNTSSSLSSVDTCWVQGGLNTVDGPYAYMIQLYAIDTLAVPNDTQLIGGSNEASSVFLSTTPNDNQIQLTWTEVVPWNNYLYEVYKETSPGFFSLIGTTTVQEYTDTGLTNGVTYCYKVRSVGDYSSPGIVSPLYNWSQEVCDQPIDLTAPCPPVLSGNGDCEAILNSLVWTNPNNYCADDVMSYNLYYSPTDSGEYEIIATFGSALDTTFQHDNNGSIAGCYYVTAVDSVQYSNESDPSNIICFDNCPYYWLPNIFTPNDDGTNDKFIPFPYKFVESVDCKIYNRWGTLVFETTDPDIRWDGRNIINGELLSEGTYYYTCLVNTIRLSGIETIVLTGHLSLVRGANFSGQ